MSGEKEKKLFDGMTYIHDHIIEEALDTPLKVQRHKWKAWGTMAACLVVAIVISKALGLQNLLPFGGNAGSGGNGHHEGSSAFMSYAGPVFPLTLEVADDTLTASRHITYDFALANEEDLSVWGAKVEDRYALSNTSAQDKTVTVRYPFVGSFDELEEQMPDITVQGEKMSPTLYAGGYSGGFTGVYGADDQDGTANILQLMSWEGYKALLEDGSYQSNAFSAHPILSQQVVVYTFTEFEAPLEGYDAATQAISFTIDPNETTILNYGFEGTELGEDGFRRYSYCVPDGVTKQNNTKLLIVLGEDIRDYELQGYTNGACEKGNEIDGVSATVTRSEEVLSDVMSKLIETYFVQYGDASSMNTVSQEMFLGAAAEYLYQYGLLAPITRDRYQYGMLEDLISETNHLKRIFYLECSITIPAHGSVSVTSTMHKQPSYDFACSRSDDVGIQGYDMVTRLGSNLRMSQLTAQLINTEYVEIVGQNFGFDLENGIHHVTLNPSHERYYLNIRPVY